jgi:3-methyl-2-oxobutanoate hydroxymethyltransferase
VKRYADVGATIEDALARYAEEVRSGAFPEPQHAYGMPEEEQRDFESALERK